MKGLHLQSLVAILALIANLSFGTEITLDLPLGKKTMDLSIGHMDNYDSSSFIKQMSDGAGKYVTCLKMQGIKFESFSKCVGMQYKKVASDNLKVYFEFLKEVQHYLQGERQALCKIHYSRICADMDMILQKFIAGVDLRKETFVTVLRGMRAKEEFQHPAYLDFLKRLFKAVDEVVEMRKLAVTFMFMSADKCVDFLKNFGFLKLDYDFNDFELLKDLMASIDAEPSAKFHEQLQHGLQRLNEGHGVSNLPDIPLWGGHEVMDEDEGSFDGDQNDKGPEVQIGDESVRLDAGGAKENDFHASVLKEKKFMDMMRGLKAKAMISKDEYNSHSKELPSEVRLTDSDLNGY